MLNLRKNRRPSSIASIQYWSKTVFLMGQMCGSRQSNTIPGTMVRPGENPQSYIIEIPTGQVQRNHSYLNVIPESIIKEQSKTNVPTQPKVIMTHSKTGTSQSSMD